MLSNSAKNAFLKGYDLAGSSASPGIFSPVMHLFVNEWKFTNLIIWTSTKATGSLVWTRHVSCCEDQCNGFRSSYCITRKFLLQVGSTGGDLVEKAVQLLLLRLQAFVQLPHGGTRWIAACRRLTCIRNPPTRFATKRKLGKQTSLLTFRESIERIRGFGVRRKKERVPCFCQISKLSPLRSALILTLSFLQINKNTLGVGVHFVFMSLDELVVIQIQETVLISCSDQNWNTSLNVHALAGPEVWRRIRVWGEFGNFFNKFTIQSCEKRSRALTQGPELVLASGQCPWLLGFGNR